MTPIKISTIRIGMCQWTLADNELISVIAYDLIPRHDENAIYYNECCFAEYYIWVLIQILRDASNKQIHSRFVFTCNQLNIYVRIDITGTYGSEYMCKFDNGTTSITNYVNDSQWVFKSSPYGGDSIVRLYVLLLNFLRCICGLGI